MKRQFSELMTASEARRVNSLLMECETILSRHRSAILERWEADVPGFSSQRTEPFDDLIETARAYLSRPIG